MKVETEIITACINRDVRAEEELYRLTYSYLISICLRYTNSREEAREMLNIGFFRILTNLKKYKLETSFKAWIHRVMVNVLIDDYRKRKIQKERIQYIESYEEIEEDTEVNSALVKMDVEQIHALIMQLPPVSQKVFNLYAIDGFSHKEIGDMLGISEGTSRWHLNFSRQRLQEMIIKVNASFKLLVG
ncbi:MAG TPA: sigma-70 family RNA polymerase sigma factor [Bacteroidia bacterium]|jgi:RNA polymerase sigma factor (sigma-70 family)|nr:sigma-70 family RNA polymerase sigma factor [Bacteroidia bacterium]